MTFQTPNTPENSDFNDDDSRTWLASLTPAELMAVTWYIRSGDPTLVDALKFTSPRLRDFPCPPFNPADVDDVSAESCIRQIDSDKDPHYAEPDYSGAIPLHLHPAFQALPWRDQTILRVQHWLMAAGDVAQVVGEWLLNMLEAYPSIDLKTLTDYERAWTIPPKLRDPRPFHNFAHGDSARAFWYATGTAKYVPPQFNRRRKPLSAAESALCEEAISSYLAAQDGDGDTLSAWELDAMEVVRAAFEG